MVTADCSEENILRCSTVQYSAVTLRCAGAGVGGIIVKPGNATSTDYRVSQLSRGMNSECLLHL